MPDREASEERADPPLLGVTAAVMALAGVRRGHLLADLAPGAGRWTRAAAAAATSSGRVLALTTAVDAHRDAASGSSDPTWAAIHRCVASPLALPVPARSLDGALWVTDPRAAREDDAAVLAEIQRAIRPGCRVVVSFPGGVAEAPRWLLSEHGFAVAHVADELWGDARVALVAARRG